MRAFIAIPPAANAMQNFKSVLHDLAILYPEKLYLTKPEKLHLTLHFFAEFDPSHVRALIFLLEKMVLPESKIFIELQKKLLLPDSEAPSVLAYRVKKTRELMALKFQIDQCISNLGYAVETREFLPHFTLARSKERGLLHQIELPALDCAFAFNEMVIYESIQKDGAFTYRPIEIINYST
jgi:2'-5' RNA ligase